MPTALELVRAMLRDEGAWCRLEGQDTFTVHVGWDQYVYVGSDRPCAAAVARTRELGLFAEPITASPYAADLAEREVTQAVDEDFWERVRAELAAQKAFLLEETYLRNATRWHLLTRNYLDTIRAGLGPRALLTVWPDLTPDVEAVLAALGEAEAADEAVDLVWEGADGTIRHVTVDEDHEQRLTTLAADARAACALPLAVDGRRPLFHVALPDRDGVLRARW